ncbi:hypothetical protein M427DRAFT_136203 [Gonapodya prolifera JEL478]|uniref:Uncharacterized protein n=1 Tax=Gonapodya prolifera (strain JEL478) TaxID=1344416 RepID=A0A139AAR4_GONPJ|nr:hypothetical protein M427DRAFT_136203 [Gonapodya prolifera JEL478]|eukprot:KXS13912.1 hypothetical protein M427DRAFT_136203 [Gonapodya prolifera JEL478]
MGLISEFVEDSQEQESLMIEEEKKPLDQVIRRRLPKKGKLPLLKNEVPGTDKTSSVAPEAENVVEHNSASKSTPEPATGISAFEEPVEDDQMDDPTDMAEPKIRRIADSGIDDDVESDSDSDDEEENRKRRAAATWNAAHEEEEMQPRARWHFWLDLDPPKMLGDVVEACIGAIYVDSGFSLPIVREVVSRVLIEPLVDQYVTPTRMPRHPITAIHELAQARGCAALRIDVLEPDHMKVERRTTGTAEKYAVFLDVTANVYVHGDLIATSKARNQKDARKQAAELALEALCTKDQWWEDVCTCIEEKQAEKDALKKKLEMEGEEEEGGEPQEVPPDEKEAGDEATVEEIPASAGVQTMENNFDRSGGQIFSGVIIPLEEEIDIIGL